MTYPDDKCVLVDKERFEELVRSDAELDVIRHAYQTCSFYSMENILDAIFNPKFKYKKSGDAKEEGKN